MITQINIPLERPLRMVGNAANTDVIFDVEKLANLSRVVIKLNVFDPDFADEGKIYLNGKSSIDLFQRTDSGQDNLTVDLSFDLNPADIVIGQNTLTFEKSKTAGYVVNQIDLDLYYSSNSSECLQYSEQMTVEDTIVVEGTVVYTINDYEEKMASISETFKDLQVALEDLKRALDTKPKEITLTIPYVEHVPYSKNVTYTCNPDSNTPTQPAVEIEKVTNTEEGVSVEYTSNTDNVELKIK